MARRPRSRASRSFLKTLTGILMSIALAVLAALGIKTDWFHGRPSAPPTERWAGAPLASPCHSLKRPAGSGVDDRSGSVRQGLDADAGGPVHRQLSGGGAREIDDPPTPVRSTVVDRHLDRLAVPEIGHLGPGSEGQPRMGGREPVLVKRFAARGLLAVKSRSVPGCLAHLLATRARVGRDTGGQRQDADQHDARETGPTLAGEPSFKAAFVTFVQESTSMDGPEEPRDPFGEAEVHSEPLKQEGMKGTIPFKTMSSSLSMKIANI